MAYVLANETSQATGDATARQLRRSEMDGTRVVTTSGEAVPASRRGYYPHGRGAAGRDGGRDPARSRCTCCMSSRWALARSGSPWSSPPMSPARCPRCWLRGPERPHRPPESCWSIAVGCAAVSTALFLAASGIGPAHRGTRDQRPGGGVCHRHRQRRAGRAPAARATRRAAAVAAVGQQHDRPGPRAADRRDLRRVRGPAHPQRVLVPTWASAPWLLAAIAVIPETVRHPDRVISLRPRLGVRRPCGP